MRRDSMWHKGRSEEARRCRGRRKTFPGILYPTGTAHHIGIKHTKQMNHTGLSWDAIDVLRMHRVFEYYDTTLP